MASRRNQQNSKSSSPKPEKTLENLSEAYRKLSPFLNIGVVWAVSVLIFTWIGIKLDSRWGTQPWLTLVGAVLGIITGFYHFYKTVTGLDRTPRHQNQPNNHRKSV